MILAGSGLMLLGTGLLLAMVVEVWAPSLFAALGAYSLLIVGLVMTGIGLATSLLARLERRH